MAKKKKYQPKMTAEEYEKLTGQKIGRLTGQSDANVNGVYRPTNG
jgi:hypothetical protein